MTVSPRCKDNVHRLRLTLSCLFKSKGSNDYNPEKPKKQKDSTCCPETGRRGICVRRPLVTGARTVTRFFIGISRYGELDGQVQPGTILSSPD